MTAIFVNSICELWTLEGPTGYFAEVLEGEIRDAGNNVHFSGSAEQCEKEFATYRSGVSVACWPTKVGPRLPEGSSGAHCWNLFME